MTIDIEVRPQDDTRLGRQKVHDEASRGFVMPRKAIDRSSWRDKAVRIYDPTPNPNQCHGECTGCAEAMMLNSVGNRVTGRVLRLKPEAHALYSWASQNDPWPGGMVYDPATQQVGGDDTGSSGLAAAKASVYWGLAVDYRWDFDGADGTLQNVQEGHAMSVGTWWYWDMFEASAGTFAGLPVVKPTGGEAGGHQWIVRGYDKGRDYALGRCWWGGFRDFWIARTDLDALLRDGGDSHHTRSV